MDVLLKSHYNTFDVTSPWGLQVDAYAKQAGLQILGLYHANALITDTELGSTAKKLADKLVLHNPQSCILLVRACV